MATSRPFAYNTGSTLPYTEQVGDIAIGTGGVEYAANYGGIKWWGGPDEDLGYVIAHTVPAGNQPNPLNVPAYLGFWRSPLKTEASFVSYTNFIFGTSYTNGDQCKTYLNNNGYWTSYVTQSNLKLHLDASDPNSYSGAGTTWYDLSSSGNDVQMENSGSISWVNTGATYFSTGSNGWFSNPSGTDLPTGNTPYTLIIWVQLGSSWSSNGFMSIGPFGIGNQSNAFRAGTTNQFINYWWGNDLAAVGSVSPATSWFNAVAKFDGTTRSILINGVSIGSDTPGGSHNVTTSALQIAKTYSNEYLNGNIGEVLIYDTALSNSDILQYYNDTKVRYEGPVTSNLRLYYDPSNTSSYSGTGTTINDLSGNGLNGTMSNITFTNPYFTYNGSSSQISVVDNALLEPGSGDWTIEFWVNHSVIAGASRVLIGKTDGGNAADWGYGIRTASNGNTYIEVGNGTTSITSPATALTINNWYQVVGVWTNVASNSIALYLNGNSVGSNSHSFTSIKNTTSSLYTGSFNGGQFSQWLNGRMGIVRMYNSALTGSQVLQNFNADKSKYGL